MFNTHLREHSAVGPKHEFLFFKKMTFKTLKTPRNLAERHILAPWSRVLENLTGF